MTIEHRDRKKLVGEVEKRNKRNSTIEVYLYEQDMKLTWTEEFRYGQNKWSIENDLVYKDSPQKICSECGNEDLLYDSKAEEFYCSVCES